MTIIRKSLIAAFGFLVAGSITPASASPLGSAKPAIAVSDVDGLHLVGDRGSWVEPKTRWKSSKKYRKHRRGHDYSRYDDHHHKKHFKRKKGRKFFKRGFKRGYGRGYDDGYYEGRRHSYYDRRRSRHHHHRHHKPYYGFQGGFAFGDGYFRGGNFGFRY